MSLTKLAEHRMLPDRLVRYGIRRLLAERLRQSGAVGPNAVHFAETLRNEDALAVATEEANHQHYEVPPAFFKAVLGSRMKYSCGYWPNPSTTLNESEVAMLRLTCDRAQLADGQSILELGCGWGSLSLWMAEQFPNSRIVAMSNSAPQREFIEHRAASENITNLEVRTANIVEFDPAGTFDRVVSVEMFEHVRNYELLLGRIRNWLNDDGKLFVHVFCHQKFAYPFEVDDESGTASANWMSKHFFTGGVMPSFDLLRHFDHDMQVVSDWWIDGNHYANTCEAWLKNLDQRRDEAAVALAGSDNPASVAVQLQRWRMFFMACGELFAYDGGRQWGVAHYSMEPC